MSASLSLADSSDETDQRIRPEDVGWCTLDITLVRPTTFAMTAAGFATFVALSPFIAIADACVGDSNNSLVDNGFNSFVMFPADMTFKRDLGDFVPKKIMITSNQIKSLSEDELSYLY